MSYPPKRTRHTLKWEIEVSAGDDVVALPIEVYFSYYPGAPARFTPWPGDPPEPADVDLISVVCQGADGKWRPLTESEYSVFDAWWWERGEDHAAEHAAEAGYA